MALPRFLAHLTAAACLAACANHMSAPLAPPAATTLLTVERVCGECHFSTHADAPPEALAHFDLVDPDWLSGVPWTTFESVFMPRILPWIYYDTPEAVYGAIAVDLAKRRGGE
jgi:hypothetical protein